MIKLKKSLNIDNIASTILLLTSGTELFCILFYKFSMLLIVVSGFVLIFKYKKVKKINIYIVISILIYAFLSTAYNNISNIGITETLAFCNKIIFIMILASTISYDKIVKRYINVMMIISIISIICFTITSMVPNVSLPFEFEKASPAYNFYGTIYYTRGVSLNHIFTRNSGIFHEPGAFQIYLNIALIFILFDKMNLKKQLAKIVIITIAILTTMSTTGYICLGIILISFLFSNKNRLMNAKWINALLLFLFAVLIYYENKTDIIVSKAIEHSGSYGTRIEDTTVAYKLAISKPVFGYGALINNIDEIWNSIGGGITSRSNGIANISMFWGLPFTLYYLICIYNKVRFIVQKNIIASILIFVSFILFISTESVLTFPLFLFFLFEWKSEENDNINTMENDYE
jgi:hypothetical protein